MLLIEASSCVYLLALAFPCTGCHVLYNAISDIDAAVANNWAD
jgi:hypothetical protein